MSSSSNPIVSSPLASTDASLLLASQRAAHTAALLQQLRAPTPAQDIPWQMKAITEVLQADEKRAQSMLDLAQPCEVRQREQRGCELITRRSSLMLVCIRVIGRRDRADAAH